MGLIGESYSLYGGFPVTLMSPVDFLQSLPLATGDFRYKATTSGGPNFVMTCVGKIARTAGKS